jgi:hypothetical protein
MSLVTEIGVKERHVVGNTILSLKTKSSLQQKGLERENRCRPNSSSDRNKNHEDQSSDLEHNQLIRAWGNEGLESELTNHAHTSG